MPAPGRQTHSRLEAIHATCRADPLGTYQRLGFEPASIRPTEARGPCPLHGGARKDSFALALSGTEAGRWRCFSECGCGGDLIDFAGIRAHGAGWSGRGAEFTAAVEELGRALCIAPSPRATEIDTTYDYLDEEGDLLFQVVRMRPKAFRQRRPGNASGKWIWNLRGVRRVLYRLPDLIGRPSEPVYLVEGEKDADTLASLGLVATTAPMGASSWDEEHSDQLRGRRVFVIPDADDAGRQGADKRATALHGVADEVRVLELPGLSNGQDVTDWVAAGGTAERLLELAAEAGAWRPSGAMTPGRSVQLLPYRRTDSGLVYDRPTRSGPVPVPLTNFDARITEDVMRDDGVETRREFELEATTRAGTRRFRTSAKQFDAMTWVTEELGASAVLHAGYTVKDHARVAIQALSDEISARTVYAHTGWARLDSGWAYLHAGGAIGAAGEVPGTSVELPDGLRDYRLQVPATSRAWCDALERCLAVLELGPASIMFPLFAAIWRATVTHTPLSLHLVGRTGTFKSQLAALASQFFGRCMTAEKLPGCWSSTGNALEGMAFTLKDALFVVDDFAPEGGPNGVERLHRDGARLFRAQANGAGRQRMRADASLRPPKPPRGTILSTGEDVPRGQSILARLLVLEVGPGDIPAERLTECQSAAAEGVFELALAGFLQRLAPRYETVRADLPHRVREHRLRACRSFSHRRTATAVAELFVGFDLFLTIAEEGGALDPARIEELHARAWEALLAAGEAQAAYQRDSDPVAAFLGLLGSALVSGLAHVAGRDGSAPTSPSSWGWRQATSTPWWSPQGDRLGWVVDDDLYLDPDAALRIADRAAGPHREGVGLGRRALSKRLHERGLLRSTERESGKTLVVRRRLEGRRHRVLHLSAALITGEAGPTDPEFDHVNGAASVEPPGQQAGPAGSATPTQASA